MKTSNSGAGAPPVNASAAEGVKRSINVELWQACAGPLVNLPAAGTHVVYFPQGHSEQVAASLKKDVDAQIPNYPNLAPKLLCLLHNVTMHADPDTDEVYAQMTLQPVPSFDKEALVRSDVSMKVNKPQTEFFCKTLTASDTSTHGGFSVPRRAAEKMFPPLDFSMQPPAQELVARDLHNNMWTFRHIFRGQPKRHLLTTGWSLFVGGKRLIAGDSVLFMRDEKQQLLLGIRGANRQPTNLSSSVLSTNSMHIGILAAAAHAAANNSPFTVFYNPRATLSEFVIPLAKYYKAVCSNQISLGMRFRMMFETEESGTRRYMGTITGIGDLDPVRWKNSQWRNLQVGWDESTAGEKRNRVSIWEIEPVTAPFFMCPTPSFFRPKRPRLPGMTDDDDSSELDSLFRRTMPNEFGVKDPQGLSLAQWMNIQQNPSLSNSNSNSNLLQSNYINPTSVLHNLTSTDQHNLQFNAHRATQIDQLPSSNFSSITQPQNQFTENAFTSRQTLVGQPVQTSQFQPHVLQSQNCIQPQNAVQQSLLNHHQLHRNLPQNQSQQQQLWNHESQQFQASDNQVQLQLLQKLNHHQHSFQDHQKQLLEIPSKFSVSSQMPDSSQVTSTRFSQPPQQTRHQQQENGILPESHGHVGITNQLPPSGGGHSAVTDDVPSCSTSQSMTKNGRNYCATAMGDEISESSATLLSSSGNLVKDLHPKSNIKPSMNVSKSQNQSFLASQTYLNAAGPQMDYLDSSSSVTSVLSQNDGQIPHNKSVTLNPQSLLFRDASHDGEVRGDLLRSNVPFVANIASQLEMPIMSDPLISSGGGMLSTYENTKEAHPELSSSFGLPEIAFNSTMNDGSFMNGGAWVPPQVPKKRTYTKVYKRGAVGRSIDISRYSGYDELIQDLARRFGIEGQLEDRQRIGWKLVYVDHENDVLLVGDDPWEEFVNCVRCIKILSPQEVQQMSLDGDFGNSVIPNQACSSSDN